MPGIVRAVCAGEYPARPSMAAGQRVAVPPCGRLQCTWSGETGSSIARATGGGTGSPMA
jgi:hypothetical protein